ncbi:MAG: type II secretion system protein [Gammaproteobacteria bacterium]|nr:type II secretion system protein [Gammaproteobacteria bacterium]
MRRNRGTDCVRPDRMARMKCRGLTLIELVAALTVTAITAAFAVLLIAAPPVTLDHTARRAALRETAAQGLDLVAREWRSALPNSLRVRSNAGVLALEHLAVLDTATVFRDDPAVPADQRLEIGSPDGRFETLGAFAATAKPFSADDVYIALHHTGAPGHDAYALQNVITPAGTRVTITAGSAAGQDRVELAPPALFTALGGKRRVALVAGAISYLCDPRAGTLQRYSGYTIAAQHAQRDSDAELMAAGAQRSVLMRGVVSCRVARAPSASAAQLAQQLMIGVRHGSDVVQLTISHVGDTSG